MKNIQLNGFDWNGFYIYGFRYSDDWWHMDLLIRKSGTDNVENRRLHMEFSRINSACLRGDEFFCQILGFAVCERRNGCDVNIETDKGLLSLSCCDIMLT
jgi:hypothetical protein